MPIYDNDVLELMRGEFRLTMAEINEALGGECYYHVRRLRKQGRLDRSGLGRRGHPYKYQYIHNSDGVEFLPPNSESFVDNSDSPPHMTKSEMRQILQELQWTQTELASRLSLDPSTPSDWREERIPGPAAAYLRLAAHMSRWEKV